jgi:hypothetical protein
VTLRHKVSQPQSKVCPRGRTLSQSRKWILSRRETALVPSILSPIHCSSIGQPRPSTPNLHLIYLIISNCLHSRWFSQYPTLQLKILDIKYWKYSKSNSLKRDQEGIPPKKSNIDQLKLNTFQIQIHLQDYMIITERVVGDGILNSQ